VDSYLDKIKAKRISKAEYKQAQLEAVLANIAKENRARARAAIAREREE
jgi:hypothetical protein